jgi:hypothetical protein
MRHAIMQELACALCFPTERPAYYSGSSAL